MPKPLILKLRFEKPLGTTGFQPETDDRLEAARSPVVPTENLSRSQLSLVVPSANRVCWQLNQYLVDISIATKKLGLPSEPMAVRLVHCDRFSLAKRAVSVVTQAPSSNPYNPPVDELVDDRLSSAQKASPKLSKQMLTVTLLIMMAIPVVTILTLWTVMPPVFEGELEATVTTMGLPNDDFYQVPYIERPPFEGGSILVRNNSDVDWTHLKMQVNHNYSTFDIEPIEAGTEKEFLLSKFITRDGKNFKVRYVPLKNFRIYARRPGGDRATFGKDFDLVENK